MIKSAKQQNIRNLCDLDAPLTDYDKWVLLKVYGLDPQPKPKVRQPYDSLTVKLKRQEHF